MFYGGIAWKSNAVEPQSIAIFSNWLYTFQAALQHQESGR